MKLALILAGVIMNVYGIHLWMMFLWHQDYGSSLTPITLTIIHTELLILTIRSYTDA